MWASAPTMGDPAMGRRGRGPHRPAGGKTERSRTAKADRLPRCRSINGDPTGLRNHGDGLGQIQLQNAVLVGGGDAALINAGDVKGTGEGTVPPLPADVGALLILLFLLLLVGGGVDDKDGMLMVLPLFHTYGLGICMHTVISGGGQAVMMPKFNAKGACRLVKHRTVTYIAGVPNMYAKMVASGKFKGKYLRKLKNCYCGGDKLSDAVKKAFEDAMAKSGNPIKLCAGYGLTEGGVCCVNTMDIHKEGTLGKPTKNNKFAVVNEKNEFLPPMQKGMLVISTLGMMSGYYNDEKLTKETIFTDKNGEKWLKTGDIGYMDEDGYVYFVDRLKRMVKISGVNVFPQEIEDLVDKYEGILRSCVISVEKEGKPQLKLYIMVKDGVVADDKYIEGLKEYIGANLLKYSVPKIVEKVESLPLTQIGKVDFKKLQEQASGN